jgi:hypothetical protein
MKSFRTFIRGVSIPLSALVSISFVLRVYLLLQVRSPLYPYYNVHSLLFPEWFKQHQFIGKLVGRNPLYASYQDAYWSHYLLLTVPAVLLGLFVIGIELGPMGVKRVTPVRHAALTGAATFIAFCSSLNFRALRLVTSTRHEILPILLLQSVVYACAAGFISFLLAVLISKGSKFLRPEIQRSEQ